MIGRLMFFGGAAILLGVLFWHIYDSNHLSSRFRLAMLQAADPAESAENYVSTKFDANVLRRFQLALQYIETGERGQERSENEAACTKAAMLDYAAIQQRATVWPHTEAQKRALERKADQEEDGCLHEAERVFNESGRYLEAGRRLLNSVRYDLHLAPVESYDPFGGASDRTRKLIQASRIPRVSEGR